MAAQKGRLYLLKLGTSGSGGTVAGVRTASGRIGNEAVDITNKDSGGWRELLEGAGTQSVDINVEGVANDGASYETFKGYAQSASINGFQLIGADNDAISGSFLIANFEESAAHNGETTFSATLQSSGTVTFTQV